MRSRLVFPIAAAVAIVLALVLSACSATVDGSPSAARDSSDNVESSGSAKSSTTRSKATENKGSAQPTTSKKQPTSDIKISQKKKTSGYEDCDLLTPEEVADAVGKAKPGVKGCIQTTSEPTVVVLLMLSTEQMDEATPIEIGGNTAYQHKEEYDACAVRVMLTDDPTAVISSFMVSVAPVDKVDSCAIALKLATKGFEKIPNA